MAHVPALVRTLGALARAARSSRAARVRFVATEGISVDRRVRVLGLTFDGRRWTVAVWDDFAGALRILDLGRVLRVSDSRTRAAPPPDGFDARELAWQPWLEHGDHDAHDVTVCADEHAAPIVAAALPARRVRRRVGSWAYRVRTSRVDRVQELARSLSPCAAVHSPSMAPRSPRSKEDTPEARLLRLAAWLLDQGEPVTRSRILEAFPDDYAGRPDAVEKKFTRDKEALRRLGYAIETVDLGRREGPGYVLSARACRLPTIALTSDEAVLLWSAATASARLSTHPLRDEVESALRKLIVGADGLPPRAAAIEELAPAPPPEQGDGMLERLVEAWERRKRMTIAYWRAAADEVVERQVDVYGWASRRGEWIFVGYCHLRKGVRIFYLSRVRKLRVNRVRAQDPDYRIPADFDVRRWSRQQVWDYDVHPPRPVTLRFKGSLARVARNLLPGAKTTLDASGGRIVRLDVRNLRGLVRQVLAWGAEAELVEPEDGREIAREILASLGAQARRTA